MATLIMCIDEIVVGLFYQNVVKYFGVAYNIVNGHDIRFTGRFWRVLFNMIRTRLKFFTANHPQIDGQLEMINVFLKEYLRFYMTTMQRNWLELLDSAQFCNNLYKPLAMEVSPFKLVLGHNPKLLPRLLCKNQVVKV
jgi:hypothetical protein